MKIYSEEVAKKDFDNNSNEDLRNMVGWIEPPDKPNNSWDVTTLGGGGFECSSQEIAQIMANTEEIKAMLLKKDE